MADALTHLLGRRRRRVLSDWLLFITLSGLAVGGGWWLVGESLFAGGEAVTTLRIYIAGQWLLLLALTFWVWRRRIYLPLQRSYAGLRRRRARQRSLQQALVQTIRAESEHRNMQLDQLLQMNRAFRDRLSALSAGQEELLRGRDALLAMSQEALLLTNATGVVLGVSPATAALLHKPRENLIGRRFEEVCALYQDRADDFRGHPLVDLHTKLLRSSSPLPRIEPALLLSDENRPMSVVVTAAPVLDPAGRPIGGSVRINRRADTTQPAAPASAEASLMTPTTQEEGSHLLHREPCERRIDELIHDARVSTTQHMLLLLRVDDLGRLNDEHGYAAGEQALWHAARNLELALLDAGTGYRYTSSRFIALLAGHHEHRAQEVAERVRAHAQANALVWEGRRIACTFSIAVLSIDAHTAGRDELLASGEALLAQAKKHGGNCVLQRAPDDAVKQRLRDDGQWLDWLLPRLDNGRAHLISQELRALSGSGAPLMEFFIRVEDDDGVWLEPGYYLPAIERLRQSRHVDLWTLRTLLDALEREPGALETYALASLNLAPATLLDAEFAPSAFELIASSPVPAEQLCFEIDESFALNQSSVVQRFMEQLRPTGVHFALDRCYTTAGLTQLRRLPIDYMKIHPDATRDIDRDALDRTHLEWICHAAHLLGRKTAAINIETESALALLQHAGVDYAQGSAVNKMGPLMT